MALLINDQEKGLTIPDKPKLTSCKFLNGCEAVLEILDFSHKDAISLVTGFVGFNFQGNPLRQGINMGQ
tara:strand:- start:4 stop:210 length:207 start_codon:yes stop_codon:yes gene_type:complete